MKTLTIQTYLRPATTTDVFKDWSTAKVYEDKQVFYKNSDGSIRGPYRLYSHFNDETFESWFTNLVMLIEENRVLVVDNETSSKAIAVYLELKTPELDDLIIADELIVHTVHYLKKGQNLEGPFQITKFETKKSLKIKATDKTMYVLTKPKDIKQVVELEMVG